MGGFLRQNGTKPAERITGMCKGLPLGATLLAGLLLAAPLQAQAPRDERPPCAVDALSYGFVSSAARRDGRYAVAPQTLCAHLPRERASAAGPIGIVVEIEPAPPIPVLPPPPRPPLRPW